jgi:hypothetical protein
LASSQKSQIDDLKEQITTARDDAKSNLETVKWLLGLLGISNIIAPLAGSLFGRNAQKSE